jgi:NTE family protein
MGYEFRNLVFEGGGVKGIAYVGALESLGRRRILPQIRRVGGTSAGAINAALFALGYSNAATRRLLAELDFTSFLDADWGVVRDTRRLLTRYGWYRGDAFHEWISARVAEQLGDRRATFGQLRAAGRPDLYVYGTNLSTGVGEIFSPEHTPAMRIADAVRISMSIPLYFAAVRNARNEVQVDGGVLSNYPIKLFDRLHYIDPDDWPAAARHTDYYARQNAASPRSSPYVYNRQTLGLRVDARAAINAFRTGTPPPARAIDDFFDYARALITTLLAAQENQHLHSDDWQRTLYIDSLGVGTLDFDIDPAKIAALLQAGRDGAAEYFAWFNNSEVQPVNRCV